MRSIEQTVLKSKVNPGSTSVISQQVHGAVKIAYYYRHKSATYAFVIQVAIR
jgi:hypothetical protein